MQENKKLNLLPQRLKNKYLNRYFIFGTAMVCGVIALALIFLFGNMAVLSYKIHSLQKENVAYNTEKTKMESLQNRITGYKHLIETYENAKFPFIRFVQDLELYRPFGVCLLSVDSADRLINEGASEKEQQETAKKDTEQKQQSPEATPDSETEKKSEEEADGVQPKIEYKKDLSGEKLVIRGYSSSQEAVSKFIYDVSHLPYITESQITAIEQHTMDGNPVNFFEFTVTGGMMK